MRATREATKKNERKPVDLTKTDIGHTLGMLAACAEAQNYFHSAPDTEHAYQNAESEWIEWLVTSLMDHGCIPKDEVFSLHKKLVAETMAEHPECFTAHVTEAARIILQDKPLDRVNTGIALELSSRWVTASASASTDVPRVEAGGLMVWCLCDGAAFQTALGQRLGSIYYYRQVIKRSPNLIAQGAGDLRAACRDMIYAGMAAANAARLRGAVTP